MSSTTTSENLSVSLHDSSRSFTVSEVRITLDGESTSSTMNNDNATGHITFTLFDRNILILLCMLAVFLVLVSLLGMVLARLLHTPTQLVKYWDNRLLEAFQINQLST